MTRYGVTPPGCQGNCPDPSIVLRRSTDGGATFGPDVFPCTCRGNQGMFDPIVEVVRSNGHVYAVWMNGYNVVFSKSTDNGVTWSAPVKTYGKVSWTDKPILAVSNDGQHVYVAWNGPTNGDEWVAQSHNAGSSFAQTKVIDSNRYTFAFDGDVANDGTVHVTDVDDLLHRTGRRSGRARRAPDPDQPGPGGDLGEPADRRGRDRRGV